MCPGGGGRVPHSCRRSPASPRSLPLSCVCELVPHICVAHLKRLFSARITEWIAGQLSSDGAGRGPPESLSRNAPHPTVGLGRGGGSDHPAPLVVLTPGVIPGLSLRFERLRGIAPLRPKRVSKPCRTPSTDSPSRRPWTSVPWSISGVSWPPTPTAGGTHKPGTCSSVSRACPSSTVPSTARAASRRIRARCST